MILMNYTVMGDMADAVLNGTFCQYCGELLMNTGAGEEPPGFPRQCLNCPPDDWFDKGNKMTSVVKIKNMYFSYNKEKAKKLIGRSVFASDYSTDLIEFANHLKRVSVWSPLGNSAVTLLQSEEKCRSLELPVEKLELIGIEPELITLNEIMTSSCEYPFVSPDGKHYKFIMVLS